MQVAVVGHVEWVEFARVELRRAGEIVHARESWEEAAGGGAVAAVQLVNLAGSCLFFTALADDELGRRSKKELEARGVTVHAGRAGGRSAARSRIRRRRRADDHGDRGEAPAVRRRRFAAVGGARRCDAVYFTGGDIAALRAARPRAGARRDVARAADAAGPPWRSTFSSGAGRTPASASSPASSIRAADRRHDRRRARRLDPSRRAVSRGADPRPGGRRVRVRRLFRGRADVRARRARADRRGGRDRRALRRDGADGQGAVRTAADGSRPEGVLPWTKWTRVG